MIPFVYKMCLYLLWLQWASSRNPAKNTAQAASLRISLNKIDLLKANQTISSFPKCLSFSESGIHNSNFNWEAKGAPTTISSSMRQEAQWQLQGHQHNCFRNSEETRCIYTGEIFAIFAPETFLFLERNLHWCQYTCSIPVLKKLMLLKGVSSSWAENKWVNGSLTEKWNWFWSSWSHFLNY